MPQRIYSLTDRNMPYEILVATSEVRKIFLPNEPYIMPHRPGYTKARNMANSLGKAKKSKITTQASFNFFA